MGAKTLISWTDHTFNIAWGCQEVSPGCAHCYARSLSERYGHHVWGPPNTTGRRTFGEKHWREPLAWNAAAEAKGVPARVFCSSMCDVFESHPIIAQERAKLWPLIRATPWLDWQLVTKRPENIAAALPQDWATGYLNVWLGASVEDQERAGRVDVLRRIPARVHFLSVEPLLGALTLDLRGIEWVIVGGESGGKWRKMDPSWAESIRDQCQASGSVFYFKQDSDFHPGRRADLLGPLYHDFPASAPRQAGMLSLAQ